MKLQHVLGRLSERRGYYNTLTCKYLLEDFNCKYWDP